MICRLRRGTYKNQATPAGFAYTPDEWHDDVAELVNELVMG